MFAGKSRRLRGALGNALLWGAAWSALGFAAVSALTGSLLNGLVFAPRFGIIGVVTGAAFSSLVPLLYRGRRLSEISPVRFGMAGGLVAGVFMPLFLQTMNVLSGGPIPWSLVLDDAPLAAVLGGIAAGGSLALAQRARTLAAGGIRSQLGDGAGVDGFAPMMRDRVAR